MEYMKFTAKTLSDAITDACTHFTVTSDKLDYVVVEEGSSGFLGIGAKPCVINARVKAESIDAVMAEELGVKEEKAAPVQKAAPVKEAKAPAKEAVKETAKEVVKEAPKPAAPKAEKAPAVPAEVEETAKKFLKDVFAAMNMVAVTNVKFNAEDKSLDIDLVGEDVGVLIGKRGQTLDSLQYLVSLVVNKGNCEYIRVKLDTENYRERRKETLENLARNIAFKVKRTHRSVNLEPMNPYERRIIHSALQNDRYVTTHSEGEEPNRYVIVSLKRQ